MTIRSLFASCAAIVLLGLSFHGEAHAAKRTGATAETPAYVDMHAYLPTWQERDAWLDVLFQLKRNFDDVCPDTFCEGEYANLEALRYTCSANTTTGEVGECRFIFAASSDEVDPDSGKIRASVHQWQCASPLAPRTDARQLLAALQGSQPLWATLPGTSTTLYEGLMDCL
jgi:hypothetical protein